MTVSRRIPVSQWCRSAARDAGACCQARVADVAQCVRPDHSPNRNSSKNNKHQTRAIDHQANEAHTFWSRNCFFCFSLLPSACCWRRRVARASDTAAVAATLLIVSAGLVLALVVVDLTVRSVLEGQKKTVLARFRAQRVHWKEHLNIEIDVDDAETHLQWRCCSRRASQWWAP